MMSASSQHARPLDTALVVASVGLLLAASQGAAAMPAPSAALCGGQTLAAIRTLDDQDRDGLHELASCLQDVARKLQKLQDHRLAAASAGGEIMGLDAASVAPPALPGTRPPGGLLLPHHLINLPPPASA